MKDRLVLVETIRCSTAQGIKDHLKESGVLTDKREGVPVFFFDQKFNTHIKESEIPRVVGIELVVVHELLEQVDGSDDASLAG